MNPAPTKRTNIFRQCYHFFIILGNRQSLLPLWKSVVKPCAQIYAVTVQISEVKMPQKSRGSSCRGTYWDLWAEVAGNEGTGMPMGILEFSDKYNAKFRQIYCEQFRQDRDTGNECEGFLAVTYRLVIPSLPVRETPDNDNACSNGILPNGVSTPPLKQTDALWQVFFAEN